jgi:hypothetical protein
MSFKTLRNCGVAKTEKHSPSKHKGSSILRIKYYQLKNTNKKTGTREGKL